MLQYIHTYLHVTPLINVVFFVASCPDESKEGIRYASRCKYEGKIGILFNGIDSLCSLRKLFMEKCNPICIDDCMYVHKYV